MTMKSLVFLLAALAVLSTAAEEEPRPCIAHDCMNSYDLSPLSASSDYIFPAPSGRNLTLNVCKPAVSDPWNVRVERPSAVGGFTRGAHGDISIGESNTTLVVYDGYPTLYMQNGSPCPQSEQTKAATVIRFVCDKSAGVGTPKLAAQLPPDDDSACTFMIVWRTAHACPLPQRRAVWKIIFVVVVIVLTLLLTLLALLTLQKLLKRRRSTDGALPPALDSAPRSWAGALGDHARDFGRLLTGQDPWGHPSGPASGANGSAHGPANGNGGVGRRWGWKPNIGSFGLGRGRRDRRNFARLPRSAEEEAMMGGENGSGGRFSFGDEDEDEHANGNGNVNGETYAEESAAWGAQRLRGMDGSGVIRL